MNAAANKLETEDGTHEFEELLNFGDFKTVI